MPECRDVELLATGWKIHIADKRSTGDYESYEARQTLEGEIPRGVDLTDEDARRELRARLLAIRKEMQHAVVQDADNRVRADGHEDWSVRCPGTDGE